MDFTELGVVGVGEEGARFGREDQTMAVWDSEKRNSGIGRLDFCVNNNTRRGFAERCRGTGHHQR